MHAGPDGHARPAKLLASSLRHAPPDGRLATMTPTPVIMDVDTGIDDAFALMLAVRHPDVDLRAVTCVGGNTGVDQVVANTCYVLDAAGAGEIPLGRGASAPLLAHLVTAKFDDNIPLHRVSRQLERVTDRMEQMAQRFEDLQRRFETMQKLAGERAAVSPPSPGAPGPATPPAPAAP